MSEINLIDNHGMFLEDFDDRSASFTAFHDSAIAFGSLAIARRTAKEINQRYGYKKVSVSYT